MKCIAQHCTNHSDQGLFIGGLCSPCHEYITTGQGVYSQAYRNAHRQYVPMTDDELTEVVATWYDDSCNTNSLFRHIETEVIKRIGIPNNPYKV